jgi:hypothetical protein
MCNGNHMIEVQDAAEQADYFGCPWNESQDAEDALQAWEGEIRRRESIQRAISQPDKQAEETLPF